MGHGHGHGAVGATVGAAYVRRMALALGLTLVYMLVQIVVGLASGSLALLSDAAHMGTDVLGLGLALAAVVLANRPGASQRTFGNYRLEVLAAAKVSGHAGAVQGVMARVAGVWGWGPTEALSGRAGGGAGAAAGPGVLGRGGAGRRWLRLRGGRRWPAARTRTW